MKSQRAKEILNSPQITNVTYQNIPVWIDELGEGDTALIRDMNSNLKMEVPVAELTEINTETD